MTFAIQRYSEITLGVHGDALPAMVIIFLALIINLWLLIINLVRDSIIRTAAHIVLRLIAINEIAHRDHGVISGLCCAAAILIVLVWYLACLVMHVVTSAVHV